MDWKMTAQVFSPPFWDEIERMEPDQQAFYRSLRMVYGSAVLNGPFAILVADSKTLMGLNDRVKLRPLVVAEEGDRVYLSSEESSIHLICDCIENVWAPKAGEPVIVRMEN
jgi:glutamate synthase domain-containing protein 1